MSDPLYLSLWFPDFSGPEMLPHAFAVLQQFPFSAQRPGITYSALHPVSWGEATVLERRFPGGIDPGQATLIAAEQIHDDYAYVFETHWDRGRRIFKRKLGVGTCTGKIYRPGRRVRRGSLPADRADPSGFWPGFVLSPARDSAQRTDPRQDSRNVAKLVANSRRM